MKNAIFTIMKKELRRFFGDKRMVFSTIIMPGLMVFIMYTFMGDAMSKQFSVDDKFSPKVEAVNMPADVAGMAKEMGMKVKDIPSDKLDGSKKKVSDKKLDLCIKFDDDFAANVASYDCTKGGTAPQVSVYYNSSSTESETSFNKMTNLLDMYESQMANKFDVNSDVNGTYDVATKEDTTGMVMSMMMPMLLLVFLFSACMSVGTESIAGEKERGTIATMLITPISRGNIALGKIIALSFIALLSGASSTIGTMLSIPSMMVGAEESVKSDAYGVETYVVLALVILSTVLVIVTLISIVSAFARTTKEAQTYVTPFMILVVLIGVSCMLGKGAQKDIYMYAIPLYNSVQCMVGIFSFKIVLSHIIVTIAANIACTGIGVFVLTRMFNSEKIMFN
ncbi:MAG: ABC transporter permease subunit [Lachnospiraceae bacterium]|nr:ABC transporter permease subunit [Lachnospiraceae bacterium]